MTSKTAKIIRLRTEQDSMPTDLALSVHLQNMFATYGEARVRKSMKELFGMSSKRSSKKAA